MKRIYVIAAMLATGSVFAQAPVNAPEATPVLEVFDGVSMRTYESPIFVDGAETPIWSEDFANGLTGWTNAGFTGTGAPDQNAQWEYRGPNTNPDTSQGSRGFFSGVNNPTPSNFPIASPTKDNGFVIFDSDYLDNDNTSTFGAGASEAPHIGTLESPTINLASHPQVIIELYSYARTFNSSFYVAFSKDGGTTYPDSIRIASALGVNGATPRDFRTVANISNFVGGESNVKIKLIFDGNSTLNSASAPGYYFWMVDDIAIKPAPNVLFSFEPFVNAAGDPTPVFDVLANHPVVWYNFFGGGTVPPGVYPITTLRQTRAIAFNANIRNIGATPQSNVGLVVEIYRGGALETTLSSPTTPLVPVLDIAPASIMETNFWTPTQKGLHACVFKVISSDLTASNNGPNNITARPDTVFFNIGDEFFGHDFMRFNNAIGTNNLGNDGSAVAVRYEIKEGSRDQALGVRLGLSAASVAGGVVEFKVFRNLDLAGGFPIAVASKTLTAADISQGFVDADFYNPVTNFGQIDMEYPTPTPVTNFQDSAFWVVAEFTSQNAQFPVAIRNDATTPSPLQSLMFIPDQGSWFSSFAGSRNFARPHLRLFTCSSAEACNFNVETVDANFAGIRYYPNPTTGRLVLDFENPAANRANLRVTDLSGKVVHSEFAHTVGHHQMDLGHLASGIYILSVEIGGKVNTYKVSIEK
jgi:hypothetical protein